MWVPVEEEERRGRGSPRALILLYCWRGVRQLISQLNNGIDNPQ